MPRPSPIGGYFELELREGPFLHSDSILLGSGRGCIEYVLRAGNVRRVLVPRYTCDVVVEPMDRLGIEWSFYDVDESLEIAQRPAIEEGDLLIANNYFGLKDAYCAALAEEYGPQLLLDCSQAYYAPPPREAHSFYTPRKFFGVPDGGCLHSPLRLEEAFPEDESAERFDHLIQRIERGAEAGYDAFRRNDASLAGQGIRRMSKLTRRLLASIDYEAAAQKRHRNFAILDSALAERNRFRFAAERNACPMVYPFRGEAADLRQRLIAAGIFVAQYWPNVLRWCGPGAAEHRLAAELIPLPIDQRYGPDDMNRILEVIG